MGEGEQAEGLTVVGAVTIRATHNYGSCDWCGHDIVGSVFAGCFTIRSESGSELKLHQDCLNEIIKGRGEGLALPDVMAWAERAAASVLDVCGSAYLEVYPDAAAARQVISRAIIESYVMWRKATAEKVKAEARA